MTGHNIPMQQIAEVFVVEHCPIASYFSIGRKLASYTTFQKNGAHCWHKNWPLAKPVLHEKVGGDSWAGASLSAQAGALASLWESQLGQNEEVLLSSLLCSSYLRNSPPANLVGLHAIGQFILSLLYLFLFTCDIWFDKSQVFLKVQCCLCYTGEGGAHVWSVRLLPLLLRVVICSFW